MCSGLRLQQEELKRRNPECLLTEALKNAHCHILSFHEIYCWELQEISTDTAELLRGYTNEHHSLNARFATIIFTLLLLSNVRLFHKPMNCSSPGSSVNGISQARNITMGCHFLLQGIFLTQGSNPRLLHCRQILYNPSHRGSPSYLLAPK